MARTLGATDVFPLKADRYGVGISWDRGLAPAVDDRGQVIDAVYHNNLKAQRCITHSGDEVTGEKSGLDEVVWIGFSKMPPHIQMIVFVVAAFTGGRLRD